MFWMIFVVQRCNKFVIRVGPTTVFGWTASFAGQEVHFLLGVIHPDVGLEVQLMYPAIAEVILIQKIGILDPMEIKVAKGKVRCVENTSLP